MTMAVSTKEEALYLPRLAELIKVEQLTEREKLFEFAFKDGGELGHQPGQFVEVSLFGIGEAPISISSSPTKKGSFELAVRRIGNVTTALHQLVKGAAVGIRGPFGRGFPIEPLKGKDLLFVCGGIGLFPLRSLINYVLDNRNSFNKIIILFGARNPKERVFVDDLARWAAREDVQFMETVDVGDETWAGHVGVITTLFPDFEIDPGKTMAFIVGPPVMYRFAIAEAKKKQLPDEQIIISLERKMKCGVGKCGHCQINGAYACQDGPVFTYAEVKNLREAL